MSDAPETNPAIATTDATDAAPASRDTRAVVGILGVIAVLILIGVLVAIWIGRSSGNSPGVLDGVRSNRIQAVSLTSDTVYFGHLKQRAGDWFELEDAYYLRNTPDAKDATKSTTAVVSVKQQAGGDGNLLLNAREVLVVQNLTAGSAIAKAIDDAKG
ncbi:MAG: hypothetical protein H7287_01135 [Thermoleophilia bacterium]|nr:hypothetical protein [Thermoleophilia bacterium]